MTDLLAAVQAPEIDYQGLSPLFATVGGALVVLMAGLVPRAVRAARAGAGPRGGRPADRDRPDDRELGAGRHAGRSSRARSPSTRSRSSCRCSSTSPASPRCCSRCAPTWPREAGAASTWRCCWARSPAWWCWPARRTWSPCSWASSCCRSRSTCCAPGEVRRAHSLEAGLKYLVVGSVGSATLLYGLALIYGATGSTDFARDRRRDRRHGRRPRRPAAAHRRRAGGHAAWRSRRRWRPSTSGRPTSTRARPPRSPASWRWPPRSAAFAIVAAPLRPGAADAAGRVGAGAGGARHRDDRDRQRRARSRSARSSGCSPGRAWRRPATCSPAWWWAPRSGCRPPPSTSPPTCS